MLLASTPAEGGPASSSWAEPTRDVQPDAARACVGLEPLPAYDQSVTTIATGHIDQVAAKLGDQFRSAADDERNVGTGGGP